MPDALVLGAGGTLGEAWLRGVLSGIEAGAAIDFRECEYLVGTSAGSIVATTLAAGRRPEAGDAAASAWALEAGDGPAGEWAPLPEEPARNPVLSAVAKAGRAAATPLAPLALATTRPAGRFARAAVLRTRAAARAQTRRSRGTYFPVGRAL